jgi:hypothetical protein
MKQTKLLGLFFSLLCVHSCGQNLAKNDQIKTQIDWKVLIENGYSIQYPNDWNLDKSGQMGMSFIILSQLSSPEDQFRENVNLLIQNLTGMNLDLDKFTAISEDQIKRMVTNGKLIESSRQNSNGVNFQKVLYSGDQGIYRLQIQQYYWIKNDKAYVLSLTCEIDQFSKYIVDGERILNSFKF